METAPSLQTFPCWLDDAGLRREVSAVDLPERCEVAVVGAGYTGLNAARELSESGADVVVVDRGSVGGGASSANAGQLHRGFKVPIERVFTRFGPDIGAELWAASLGGIDLVERLVAELGVECDFVRAGSAELGTTKHSLREFEATARWLEDHVGFEARIVGPSRISDIAAVTGFTGALVDDVGASLNPARYAQELARVAVQKGAVIVEDAAVLSISRHTLGFQLLTAKGKLTADSVLLATNGYTGRRPVPKLRRRVLPVGSYAIATAPLPRDRAAGLIPHQHNLHTTGRSGRFFRMTPDRRMLLSGSYNLSTELDLAESADRLATQLRDAFPQLAGAEITHSWGSPLGVSFDLLPHLGRIDGMWYALGYSGHGVALATYLGVEAAHRMAGTKSRSPFEDIPHPTRPYYRTEPWFQPATARWYRFLDAIGR